MKHNQTRQHLALDMLLVRADGKLNDKLQFRPDDKPIILQAVQATNVMFESRISLPFNTSLGRVTWNRNWMMDNNFTEEIMPGYVLGAMKVVRKKKAVKEVVKSKRRRTMK